MQLTLVASTLLLALSSMAAPIAQPPVVAAPEKRDLHWKLRIGDWCDGGSYNVNIQETTLTFKQTVDAYARYHGGNCWGADSGKSQFWCNTLNGKCPDPQSETRG
ncbi:UNVERIFIED_CONTAM: hypothetical protein HDU68_009786 [Siphonaria sp. JEL0065]|nr:hypothetical protein HDU68_009786 [Siphonaria sp. JEL0065]